MEDSKRFRIIYLWIEEYKNVKKQELYFTQDYQVKRDDAELKIRVEGKVGGRLRVEETHPLEDLDNFCAVVGKNGSGKSNVFELVSYLNIQGEFPKNISENADRNFAIVELEQNGNKLLRLVSISEYYRTNYQKTEGLDFSSKIQNDEMELSSNTILYHPLNDLAAGATTPNTRNLYKITSNPFQKLIAGTSNSALAKQFSENVLALDEIELFKDIAANPYSRLVILYDELQRKYLESTEIHDAYARMSRKSWIHGMYRKFDAMANANDEQPTKTNYKIIYLFLSFWSALQGSVEKDEAHINALLLTSNLLGEHSPFLEFQVRIDKRLKRNSYNSYIEAFKEHMKVIDDELEGFQLEYNLVNGSFLSNSVTQVKSFQLFNCFCSDEMFNLGHGNIIFQGVNLPIKIDGLSSGEISIIHFLNELKKAIENSVQGSCLILLDEPENSFHPEWQRLLISILIELFNKLNVKPQVLISSHSPFVLSDILSGKALMLGNSSYLESCFAANIHELLANSFFLSSTIGEAAKDKIELLVKFINNSEDDSSLGEDFYARRRAAFLILDQIGDKLLKNELRKQLNKVVNAQSEHEQLLVSLATMSQEIPGLREELQSLKERYSEES